MITRRAATGAALGLLAVGAFPSAGMAQGNPPAARGGLRNRGAPTGRVGAAARDGTGPDGPLSLELVAPQTGIGLTSSDQPVLFYLLSGPVTRPLHLTISVPNRSRPLADIALDRPQIRDGTGMTRLRDRGIRLLPDAICTWSIATQIDPAAPSRDLVASALIRYVPMKQTLATELSRADRDRRYALLTAGGYWYDAVAHADESRPNDGGAAFRYVLHALGLEAASQAG